MTWFKENICRKIPFNFKNNKVNFSVKNTSIIVLLETQVNTIYKTKHLS